MVVKPKKQILSNHCSSRLSIVKILGHESEKRGPMRMHIDFLALISMSNCSNSCSTMSRSFSCATTEGAIIIMSSAYNIMDKHCQPIWQPNKYSFLIRSIMPSTYNAKRYGDKTPPCRIPHVRVKNDENVQPHLTHVRHEANQFSKIINRFFVIHFSMSFMNNP